MADIVIESIGGYCPVQAEGTVNGEPFYFRSRWQHWSLSIGGEDVISAPAWFYEELYLVSGRPYAAGYIEADQAKRFIEAAVERYLRGEPDGRGTR